MTCLEFIASIKHGLRINRCTVTATADEKFTVL